MIHVLGAHVHFTPTELRMMHVLCDGKFHGRWELHACLNDELQCADRVWTYVSLIRKKIQPHGRDITCERRNRMPYYRLVIMINNDE